jgi:hypothetical protein
LLLSFCVAPPIVAARTSTPPKNEASAACLPTTSTSTTSASRAIVYMECTPVSNPAITFAPAPYCDCGEFQLVDFYSSLIVRCASVVTAGDVRPYVLCVCVWGGALLLGCWPIRVRVKSLYTYPFSMQYKKTVQNLTLMIKPSSEYNL